MPLKYKRPLASPPLARCTHPKVIWAESSLKKIKKKLEFITKILLEILGPMQEMFGPELFQNRAQIVHKSYTNCAHIIALLIKKKSFLILKKSF